MNARTNTRTTFPRTLTIVGLTIVAMGFAQQAAAQVKVVIQPPQPPPKAVAMPKHWPADARAAVTEARREADLANREAAKLQRENTQLQRDNAQLQRDNDALRRQQALMERELAALRKASIEKDRTIRDLEIRLARERDRNNIHTTPKGPGFTSVTPDKHGPGGKW